MSVSVYDSFSACYLPTFCFKIVFLFFQFERREVESHLQSDLKPHLDLACVRLKETEVKLKDTREKLESRVFIWRIGNYRQILRKARTGEKTCIQSAPFYTDRTESYGYKLRAVFYPNGSGSGENTHLAIFIIVMKGKYDAILPWPFKKKVKFTLIDQQEDPVQQRNVTRHLNSANQPQCLAAFVRPTSEQNSGWGFSRFISHEDLYSRRYFVDDTLFLKVEVGPSSSQC